MNTVSRILKYFGNTRESALKFLKSILAELIEFTNTCKSTTAADCMKLISKTNKHLEDKNGNIPFRSTMTLRNKYPRRKFYHLCRKKLSKT